MRIVFIGILIGFLPLLINVSVAIYLLVSGGDWQNFSRSAMKLTMTASLATIPIGTLIAIFGYNAHLDRTESVHMPFAERPEFSSAEAPPSSGGKSGQMIALALFVLLAVAAWYLVVGHRLKPSAPLHLVHAWPAAFVVLGALAHVAKKRWAVPLLMIACLSYGAYVIWGLIDFVLKRSLWPVVASQPWLLVVSIYAAYLAMHAHVNEVLTDRVEPTYRNGGRNPR